MLVGCVGTGELKLQGSENKEHFVKLASSVTVTLGRESVAFKNLEGRLAKTFL
jgi:hypothetical protein